MAQSAEAIRAYASLLVQATIPLVLGSFKSLKTPESTKRLKQARLKAKQSIPDPDEDEAYDDENSMDEMLTWGDTLIIPIFGSVALLGMWLIIKYAGKEWINFVLGIYFSGAGMFAIQDTLGSIANWITGKLGYKPSYYHIRISSSFKQIYHSRISLVSLAVLPIAIGAPLLYIPLQKHYLLSNLIALCLATSTLGLLKLDSFLSAIVLLSALLVYDIFWVFGTPVMVDVATSIDAPIKLLAPRSSSSSDFALLGLGDIVIPGLMISLCLRFDLYRYAKFNPNEEITNKSRFNRSYFLVGMVSYILGLGGCMWIMSYFGRAQPALLYLSPACILGPLSFALLRGEFPLLWSFVDGADSTDIKDDTIEPPSEAAQRAREEAKAKAKAAKVELGLNGNTSMLTLLLLMLLGCSQAQARESFHESLTLLPLPNGKLAVSFDFTTEFDMTLTPPSLLLPLACNNVSELTISFVAGQWNQGPIQSEAGGGGGEIRGWLKDGDDSSSRWTAVTQALGGLFCAGLGPDDEESVNTFGHVYPPHGSEVGLTHRLLSTPYLPLCTENLTPFLSLLPSKGHSGLSSLLAQPGIIFSWGFKTEGIEVIMPIDGQPGRWRGWWEGVVDLVPEKGASRAFSLGSLFKQGVPKPFPEASSSALRLVKPDAELDVSLEPDTTELMWIDGKSQKVLQWDLMNKRVQHKDIRISWPGEQTFQYPRTIDPPPIVVHRTVTSPRAMDGVFTITIQNNANIDRDTIYSEIWPWWVKGWISGIQVRINGQLQANVLDSISYHPSTPPKPTTTSIHLSLTLPARSKLVLTIPFSKLMLKYTEHRPDAERGREISSGVLTLLDLVDKADFLDSTPDVLRSDRTRIYTPRLLLDVPTPDFSMPYNVIIMSSTVMAVFFGMMHGSLTRRWGWIQLPKTAAVVVEGKGE